MKFKLKLVMGLIVWLGWLGTNSIVAAAPSQLGSTGMIRIPTADSLRLGQFSAGYFVWRESGTGVVAVGLPRGIELSAAAKRRDNLTDTSSFNIKFSLNQEALLYPAVAIGVEDIAGQERRSVYGVISKTLPYGFRIHIGTGTGRFEGMFGAVEKVLNPTPIKSKAAGFPVTSLIVEMDGAHMNYGARMRLAQGLRLDLGWQGRDEKVYLGLTFTN